MRSFILSGLLSLMMLFPNLRESTLKDIAKPYLGEYECKSAQLGKKDLLENFSYIRIELKDSENFTLYYKEKEGKGKEVEGKYVYDKEKELLMLADKSGVYKRGFPLNEGILTISLPMGEKNLVLKFEQK